MSNENNVIQIKRGTGVPKIYGTEEEQDEKGLHNYELGYSTDNKLMYINNGGTITIVGTVPRTLVWQINTSVIGSEKGILTLKGNGFEDISVDIPKATTNTYGITKLDSSLESESEVLAATPKAVKGKVTKGDSKIDIMNKDLLLSYFYPIGTIYQTSLPENPPESEEPKLGINYFNPADAWGGSWILINGKFLLSAGTLAAETSLYSKDEDLTVAIGDSGGYKTSTLPSHNHNIDNHSANHSHSFNGSLAVHNGTLSNENVGNIKGSVARMAQTTLQAEPWTGWYNGAMYEANVSFSHNVYSSGNTPMNMNLPPYEVVNIWKRIA